MEREQRSNSFCPDQQTTPSCENIDTSNNIRYILLTRRRFLGVVGAVAAGAAMKSVLPFETEDYYLHVLEPQLRELDVEIYGHNASDSKNKFDGFLESPCDSVEVDLHVDDGEIAVKRHDLVSRVPFFGEIVSSGYEYDEAVDLLAHNRKNMHFDLKVYGDSVDSVDCYEECLFSDRRLEDLAGEGQRVEFSSLEWDLLIRAREFDDDYRVLFSLKRDEDVWKFLEFVDGNGAFDQLSSGVSINKRLLTDEVLMQLEDVFGRGERFAVAWTAENALEILELGNIESVRAIATDDISASYVVGRARE